MKTQLSKLISAVTKAEGKKKAVSIGNVREVLRVLKDIVRNDPAHFVALIEYLGKK